MNEKPELFIKGYLDNKFKNGQLPTYGYPKTKGLPEIGEKVMLVKTCFSGDKK